MTVLLTVIAEMRSGRWIEAHNLVQKDGSPEGAWLHGILHLQKGDLEDAEYWYDKAQRSFRDRGTLLEETAGFETHFLKGCNHMRTNLNIIADHYAASARQDITSMMAEVSPDVQWTEMAGFPCAGTWTGPEQITENVFKILDSEWRGYRFDLEELIDAGARIIGVGHYCGTYRKTGKFMQVRATHIWTLNDGKIVRFEQFTDTLLVDKAMN